MDKSWKFVRVVKFKEEYTEAQCLPRFFLGTRILVYWSIISVFCVHSPRTSQRRGQLKKLGRNMRLVRALLTEGKIRHFYSFPGRQRGDEKFVLGFENTLKMKPFWKPYSHNYQLLVELNGLRVGKESFLLQLWPVYCVLIFKSSSETWTIILFQRVNFFSIWICCC